jgi:hypothetical protein
MYAAIPFITNTLNKFSEKHENMSFLYGYDQFLCQHIIDVNPKDSYDSDAYLLDEVDFIADFITRFPEESILFVSNDDYIKVNDPIHYAKKGAVKYFSQLQFNEVEFHMNAVSVKGELNIVGSISDVFHNIKFNEMPNNIKLKLNEKWNNQDVFAGDNTYAMAA